MAGCMRRHTSGGPAPAVVDFSRCKDSVIDAMGHIAI